MEFYRPEYWSGLLFPRHFPDPGIEPTSPVSPALAGGFFTISTTWETLYVYRAFKLEILYINLVIQVVLNSINMHLDLKQIDATKMCST